MIHFLKQFIKSPREIGALTRSSKGLAELITNKAELEKAAAVVELGPGTGVVTRCIKEKLPDTCTFFALETNTSFVTVLKDKLPELTVYNDSAANLTKYLDKVKLKNCDRIISGLPWAAFNEDLQRQVLDAVSSCLGKGGYFLTYVYLQARYLPAGVRFRRLLQEYFADIQKTKVIWLNIMPAFVYVCRK
ncbi:MAG TPA: rRNA adenine N-6-methyltransferase family protein [Spirochaetota bacterium]|nr:rRNA adenine N-6-methyltransferase family protein [Spirochaetota bacterium]